MSTGSATPIGTAAGKTRWIWVVRIGAGISIGLVGLYIRGLAVWFSNERDRTAAGLLVMLSLTLVAYLAILVSLRGKTERNGLALAAITGWAGLIGGMAIIGDLPGPGFLILVAETLLLAGTYRTYAALRRLTGDKRKLMEGTSRWSYSGSVAFLGYLSLVVLPAKVAANQASAVNSLRTINAAEANFARTYKNGYSRNLAALGPRPAGAQPSTSAADLIPSELAIEIHSGYKFTYAPGLPDKDGHIRTYTVNARPLDYFTSGRYCYFTNQLSVIRGTSEGRPATVNDPSITY